MDRKASRMIVASLSPHEKLFAFQEPYAVLMSRL